jgi:hypothetical protein
MDRRSIWSIWSICQDSSECARDVAWTSRHLSADIALYGSVGKARFWNHQPLSDHNLSVCRAAQRRHGPPSKLYTASCPLNLSSHIKEGQNRQDPTTHGTGAPLPLSGRLSHILASLICLQDVSKVSAFQSDAQAKPLSGRKNNQDYPLVN